MPEGSADWLIRLVEGAAVLAFALSGVIEATRRRMDVVGICSVAFVTAFGGGTLRDVLLDKRPFFWVAHWGWVWVVLILSAGVALWWRSAHATFTERAIRLPDALGLGLFGAVGTSQAAALDMPAVVSALMGVVTAVFGGVLRDIVCNEIPRAFRDHQPYAICAFAGAWVVVVAKALDAPQWLALLAAAGTATLLRVLAIQLSWTLPAWRPGAQEEM